MNYREVRDLKRDNSTTPVGIREVNMDQSYIKVEDPYGGMIQINMDFHDSVVTIPQTGETWLASRSGNAWTLTKRLETGDETVTIASLEPGDKRIEAPNNLYLSGKTIFFNGFEPVSIDDPRFTDQRVPLDNSVTNAKIVAGISISKLAGYPSDATKELRGDGTWTTTNSWTYGTTFPGSPLDGDTHTLVDSTTVATWHCLFRYNAGASSIFKWEALGGVPQFILDTGAGRQNSADNVWELVPGIATTTAPRAGQYRFRWGGTWTGNNNTNTYIHVGGAAGVALGATFPQINLGNAFGSNEILPFSGESDDAKNSISRTAGSTIAMQMQSSAHTNVVISNIWYEVIPIRCS